MEVRSVSGRGRGLFALDDLPGGHIVLRESPLLVYVEAEAAGSFCEHCSRCVSSSPACESCSRARFCDERCHRAAIASSHAPWICLALQAMAGMRGGFETETQARFLLAAVSLAARNPGDFQRLLLLDGQASVFADDPRPAGVAAFVMAALKTHCFELAKGFSEDMLVALLAKDKINAFGLMAPSSSGNEQRKVRAYALYAQASMLNHGCLPNACRFEYLDKPGESNTDIYIRLLHDVPKGSEICISYFPINWNYKERQDRLLEDYHFECKCERCRVEQTWSDDDGEGDEEEAMEEDRKDGGDDEMNKDGGDDFPHAMFFVKYLCPEECCGGTMAPLPGNASLMECNVCGRLRSEQEFVHDLEQHCTA